MSAPKQQRPMKGRVELSPNGGRDLGDSIGFCWGGPLTAFHTALYFPLARP